jgi:hypothetical protein
MLYKYNMKLYYCLFALLIGQTMEREMVRLFMNDKLNTMWQKVAPRISLQRISTFLHE